MTSERLLNTSIEVLYLPQNFYTSQKQISGYAPDGSVATHLCGGIFSNSNITNFLLILTLK